MCGAAGPSCQRLMSEKRSTADRCVQKTIGGYQCINIGLFVQRLRPELSVLVVCVKAGKKRCWMSSSQQMSCCSFYCVMNCEKLTVSSKIKVGNFSTREEPAQLCKTESKAVVLV